jgi:septal ring factor EnvC (AmiA/AmiB activator)
MKTRFSFGLALFLFLCAYSVQAQEADLDQLSSSISNKLTNLKAEIRTWNDDLLSMTERLDAQSKDLATSENEALQWKEKSTTLSASLTNISNELTSSHELTVQLREQLKTATKIAIAFFAIIVIRFLFTIVGYALMAKGIKVPLWLALLL